MKFFHYSSLENATGNLIGITLNFSIALGEKKVTVTQFDSAIPWTVASLAPLSMEFSRQEYWSG